MAQRSLVLQSKGLAKMYLSVTQSINTSTQTVIQFGTKSFDIRSEATTGASARFTALENGYYKITAKMSVQGRVYGNGEYFDIYFKKNGTTIVSTFETMSIAQTSVSTWTNLQGSDIIFLNATDYIEILVAHNSSGTVSLGSGENLTSCLFEQIT